MDNYYDIEEPKKGFTVGKLFKWIFLAVTLLMLGILVARCTMYSDDDIVQKVLVNDTFRTAYESDDFKIERYGMKNAWVAVRDRRMVEFNCLYHIKSARQLQFSVKYNLDIAEYIGDDGVPFKFKLVDNYSNVYDDYWFENTEKFGYGYIRLCFEGIDLIDDTAEPDKNGVPARKTYTVYVYQLDGNGEYTELCRYKLYDGSGISKTVDFKLK